MTTPENRSSERSRFPAVNGHCQKKPRAAIQYSDSTEIIPVQIRDLSDSGAGFVMTQAPRLSSLVVLTLYHSGRIERIHAAILWARPNGHGLWRAGCRFEGRMRTARIATAATTTPPEHRAQSIPFIIRCELDQEIRATARVLNYSNGGLCVRSAEAFPPKTKLLFEAKEINPPVRFVALVQWTRKDQDCYRMGCSFVGCCDMEAFRRCLPEFAGRAVHGDPEVDSEPEAALSGVWAGVRAGLRLVGSAFTTEPDHNHSTPPT